jgi:ornithine carbamoyltransferase
MDRQMTTQTTRNFLDLDAVDAGDLRGILDHAKEIKAARAGMPKGAVDGDAPLQGYVLAAIFEEASTRTRVSFDVGMRQLGGETLVLSGKDMQLGRGETITDTAQVLSRFVDVIVIRTLAHDYLLELAEYATVPVINGLTNRSHPCQLMADMMTIEEHRGPVAGKVMVWSGDGNNVAASLAHAAVQFDFELRVASPKGFELDPEVVAWAKGRGGKVHLLEDPREAVDGADCVFADTWVSLGDKDRDARLQALGPYQVNQALMDLARDDALFLHCLPAHRGEEATDEVMDGPQSVVWDEAENRLHAQKAILRWTLGK